jgi:hypothetical protein
MLISHGDEKSAVLHGYPLPRRSCEDGGTRTGVWRTPKAYGGDFDEPRAGLETRRRRGRPPHGVGKM